EMEVRQAALAEGGRRRRFGRRRLSRLHGREETVVLNLAQGPFPKVPRSVVIHGRDSIAMPPATALYIHVSDPVCARAEERLAATVGHQADEVKCLEH